MSSLDYLDLCRLCLMKDRVSVPIFEGEGDVRQIFLKIAACLPVKVAREDKLPKKICDDCVYKVELLYQFWNTTANAEKQLLQWLGEVGLEDKQGYVTGVLNPSTMKQEENNSSGLGGAAIQVTGVQPGIGIGVIDNMGLGMPLIIPSSTQQQLTAVPMDTSTGPIQPIQSIQQAVPGPSSQPGHEQITQSQTNATTHQQDEEEDTSEDEENSDDDCDGDDGLPVKEESEEDPNNSRTIEPTTFVNVSLACDEAGPSGLQQQKIVEIPEMAMPQTTDGDPKSGTTDLQRNRLSEFPAVRSMRLAKLRALSKYNCTACCAPRIKSVSQTPKLKDPLSLEITRISRRKTLSSDHLTDCTQATKCISQRMRTEDGLSTKSPRIAKMKTLSNDRVATHTQGIEHLTQSLKVKDLSLLMHSKLAENKASSYEFVDIGQETTLNSQKRRVRVTDPLEIEDIKLTNRKTRSSNVTASVENTKRISQRIKAKRLLKIKDTISARKQILSDNASAVPKSKPVSHKISVSAIKRTRFSNTKLSSPSNVIVDPMETEPDLQTTNCLEIEDTRLVNTKPSSSNITVCKQETDPIPLEVDHSNMRLEKRKTSLSNEVTITQKIGSVSQRVNPLGIEDVTLAKTKTLCSENATTPAKVSKHILHFTNHAVKMPSRSCLQKQKQTIRKKGQTLSTPKTDLTVSESVICHICHKVFRRKQYLKKHMLLHDSDLEIEDVKWGKISSIDGAAASSPEVKPILNDNDLEPHTAQGSRRITRKKNRVEYQQKAEPILSDPLNCHTSLRTSLAADMIHEMRDDAKIGDMRLDKNEISSSNYVPDYSRENEIALYGDISELVKCDKCQKIFKKKSYLRAHLLKIHEKKNRRKVEDAKLIENKISLGNVITCARDTERISQETNHSASKKTMNLTEMPLLSSKKNLAHVEETKSSINLIACADKSQPSSHSFDLDKPPSLGQNYHMISILPKSQAENQSKTDSNFSDRLPCPMCCKTFKKSKYLKVHIDLHSAIHICHICGYKSRSQHYLKVHVRRHNKEFTEFCKICNKGFYGKWPLQLHMTTHADKRPYVCKVCKKSFHNQFYLNSHEKLQHKSETRPKFICETCNFQTFYKHSFKLHMSSHTGEAHISCEVCGKLIRKNYMKIHMRSHTNDKSEVCQYCKKVVRSRRSLVQHQKTHTYGRLECAICNEKFNLRRKLVTHLKLMHKGGE